MRYILNSAVITAPGYYEYRLITADEAKAWLAACDPMPLSTMGYQETADALERLTGYKFPVNRFIIKMQAEDEALVFRLTCRLNDPACKGKMTTDFILKNCEIGVLKRDINLPSQRAGLRG